MEKVLRYLNNYFYRFGEKGDIIISNGRVNVKGNYVKGQYVRLIGTIINNEVLKVISVDDNTITLEGAENEEFEGVLYSLAIPRELMQLSKDIEAFNADNKKSGLASESFGNYSYSKAMNKNGDIATWKDVFVAELKPFRRTSDGIRNVKIIGGK